MVDERKNVQDVMVYPNEYVWVVELNGQVVTRVGPCNITLQPGEKLVRYDLVTKRFTETSTGQSQSMTQAPEGYYVRLENPAEKGIHPIERDKQQTPRLEVGKVVNIPGPVAFALWPGQVASVIEGHRLRANSYVVARVYNVEAVKESGVLKDVESLVMGQLLVIRGDKVEFFIPPTGLEVLGNDETKGDENADPFVRDAVTLERLEYCLLRDQSGEKRYVQGPAIVFPKPTEEFATDVREDGTLAKKFRAYEMQKRQGLYIKVIADYQEKVVEQIVSFHAGEELFLTGETTPIYFPRIEHSLILYGKHVVHAGIAIPAGQGRYLHERLTGTIRLVRGPNVYLPDPRSEIVARRTLPKRYCELMYPGNAEVLVANGHVVPTSGTPQSQSMQALYEMAGEQLDSFGFAPQSSIANFAQPVSRGISPKLDARLGKRPEAPVGTKLVSNTMDRQGQYQGPRTITLDGRGKYEGAVAMTIWSGYAVLLVRLSGPRCVVEGPTTVLLEYDEFPHILTFSTGKPKTTDKVDQSVYLRVKNNYVTDIVEFETQDYCTGTIKICYRLDFEGDDPELWFAVENYVKLLADHMRSLIRAEVRGRLVKDFYAQANEILETLILGEADDSGERRGYSFEENGMHVHGIEILKVSLGAGVQKLIEDQQTNVLARELSLQEEAGKTKHQIALFDFKRALDKARDALLAEETSRERSKISDQGETKRLQMQVTQILRELEHQMLLDDSSVREKVAAVERSIEKAQSDYELAVKDEEAKLAMTLEQAQTSATVAKFQAFTPDLVSALEAYSERDLLGKLGHALGTQGVLGTLGGDSVVDVLGKLLEHTGIGDKIPKLLGNGNGASARAAAPAAE